MVVDKRKRPLTSVGSKKIKLDKPQELPEVDNMRKEVNKVYSKILSKDARDKTKLIQKALGLIGEDLLSASKKHDLCRVVQVCLKHGSDQQKRYILENLKQHFTEIASGKYSYFLAKKLLKFEDKDFFMSEVLNNARAMFCTIYGIRFLDLLYNEGKYKSKLLQSIFGLEPEQTVSDVSPEVIAQLKNSVPIKKIFKKGLIDYNLVMHVVYIYLTVAEKDEKYEVLTQLYEKFETLIRSRYGTILAIQALAISDTKQRKLILKASQSLIKYIYDPESYAYLFFIKLIQVIDDTKRVNKMIGLPIIYNMKQIIHSNTGAKFLITLFPYEFTLGTLSTNEFEALEEDLNLTSKKDLNIKKKEVFIELSSMIIKEIINDFQNIIIDPRLNFLIVGVALSVIYKDVKSEGFVMSCAQACVSWDVMDDNCGHRILKKIIELESDTDNKVFVKNFLKVLNGKTAYLEKLIKSKGVWLFVCLVEKTKLKNKAKNLFRTVREKLDPAKSGEKALLELII
jgi:pumilio homology domain family member 6